MSDCLFCKIAEGEIPSTKIYETDAVLAFRDIDPQAPFHVVIIPKTHIASAKEITADNSGLIAQVFEAAAVIAKEQGLENGFRIVNNCGEEGGQTVGHIHFHMLAGRLLAWPPG
ncbi:MAG: histidine triad nucleotide-binding protein [Candidatus Howiella sp.]|jgi:histidine triad (HIT) family protein